MNAARNRFFEFGSYKLIPAERLLLRDDAPINLPAKAFDTLVILVENSGQVVRKDTLIDRVWPDAFVEENNLNQYVSLLRRTLADGKNGSDYIETVRGYGYRFKAMVRATAEENEILVHRRERTHIVLREEAIEQFKETRLAGESNEALPQESTRPAKSDRAIPARRLMFAAAAATVVLGGVIATYFANRSQTAPGNTTAVSSARGGMSNNPEAMAAYARGREFWNKRTREDMVKAQREFQSALALDPGFAAAYAGLADCLLLGGNLPFSSETSDSLAKKALAIDDTCAEAHTSLAYYKGAVEWDWEGAEFHFRRAIELNPHYATARHWHAYNLASLDRMDEALAEIREAHRLDLASAPIATDMGQMLYFAKKYDEAIAQYRTVLERSPDFSQARLRLAEAYAQKQRWNDALAELEEVNRLKKHRIPAWFAYTYALGNRRDEAIRILNRLKTDAELMKRTFEIAVIYASLGDKDSAFAWLEKSLENHEGNIALIKVDPVFDNLRSDARYSVLLRRMNLE